MLHYVCILRCTKRSIYQTRPALTVSLDTEKTLQELRRRAGQVRQLPTIRIPSRVAATTPIEPGRVMILELLFGPVRVFLSCERIEVFPRFPFDLAATVFLFGNTVVPSGERHV